MTELIDLNECAKILGIKRNTLTFVVNKLVNFPKPIVMPKSRKKAFYDKAEIQRWNELNDGQKLIKQAFNIIYKNKKAKSAKEANEKALFETRLCNLFLSGMFDPLEKRLEYETKKYNALQRPRLTKTVHLKSAWQ